MHFRQFLLVYTEKKAYFHDDHFAIVHNNTHTHARTDIRTLAQYVYIMRVHYNILR